MAEVTLKKKITLRKKQEECAFTFSGKLKVKLLWNSPTDLDLCIFFKKKDGEVGGASLMSIVVERATSAAFG